MHGEGRGLVLGAGAGAEAGVFFGKPGGARREVSWGAVVGLPVSWTEGVSVDNGGS